MLRKISQTKKDKCCMMSLICFFFKKKKKKRTSLVTQMVKNGPAMWETWVRSLGWEDPLEENMATHSSILAWRIPMNRRV